MKKPSMHTIHLRSRAQDALIRLMTRVRHLDGADLDEALSHIERACAAANIPMEANTKEEGAA